MLMMSCRHPLLVDSCGVKVWCNWSPTALHRIGWLPVAQPCGIYTHIHLLTQPSSLSLSRPLSLDLPSSPLPSSPLLSLLSPPLHFFPSLSSTFPPLSSPTCVTWSNCVSNICCLMASRSWKCLRMAGMRSSMAWRHRDTSAEEWEPGMAYYTIVCFMGIRYAYSPML